MAAASRTSTDIRSREVESTRREVASLEMDSATHGAKASGNIGGVMGRMVSKAKDGWERIKSMLEGKKLVRQAASGKLLLKDEEEMGKEAEVVMEEWEEDKMGGVIVIEEEEVRSEKGTEKGSDNASATRGEGFEFLEGLETEERDEELEVKRQEGRKRKREGSGEEQEKGLLGMEDWKRREAESRDAERWKREVGKWQENEKGEKEFVKEREKIPLPENFRLGLDGRGKFLNNSSKIKNNFGLNKGGLFEGGQGGQGEKKNWISTFTKSGCIGCRNEEGGVNHKGRDGTPGILVVGDESVPTVVGHTGEGSKEATCAWVLKKEHLALNEVAPMLAKINTEKKEADKKRGKRAHEFFIPNGSKILVGSYVHLRREGLEGYVTDFNTMVREVRGVTGDTGIEVLPVAPVVFDGIDDVGKTLISGVREWIKWVGGKSGRAEIGELSETGGREVEEDGKERMIWRPSFMLAHGQKAGLSVLLGRGNTLTLIREERVEWELKRAGLAKEIQRMVDIRAGTDKKETDKTRMDVDSTKGEGGSEAGEGQDRRDNFDNGVSIEGEFSFVRAIGNFCRESVRGGSFKGNYKFNAKEQMEMREFVERKGKNLKNVTVVLVGGSQIGRLAKEMGDRKGIDVLGMVRVKGRLDDSAVENALDELAGLGVQPEKVLIGGPTNSLVEHGVRGLRGFGPERKVRVRTDERGNVTELEASFHMTEPRRIVMSERRDLVDRVVRLIRGTQALFPWSEVSYATMFPRHVEPCCATHMTCEDVWMMDSVRRDVDKDIIELLMDNDEGVSVIEWWDVLGFDGDMTVRETLGMRIVGSDGVHLTDRANKCAASSLCTRFCGDGDKRMGTSYGKKRKTC